MTSFTSSTLEIPRARRIPRHVAVIMDGNGRWAKQRHLPRVAGHRRGVKSVRDLVLKATKVDGVYTDDPKTHPDAMRYQRLTFDEAIIKNLKVMDATALTLCRDQKLPINVFSIFKPEALKRIVLGEDEGTFLHN